MAQCDRCRSLPVKLDIDSRETLQQLLTSVHQSLAAGDLLEAAGPFMAQAQTPRKAFASVPIGGPWPDYMEYWFRCAGCGKSYKLSVETFHGAGGEWSMCK
jgi:hypothetical protein